MNRNSTPYSQLKIFRHPDLLNRLLEGERCVPLYIRIKPTNKCNHNCDYCHYKNSYLDLDEYNPNDEIPREKMLEFLDDLHDMGTKAVTFSGGGEPLLYPYIAEAMERVIDHNIDLSIITNGSLLKDEKADLLAKAKWVRISLESADDDQYCKVRGIKKGSFNELCKNMSHFSEIKDEKCEFGVNVVVSKENCTQVKKMARLMKGLGVNHVKFTPLMSNDAKQYHKDIKEKVSDDLAEAQVELDDDRFRVIDLYTGDFKDSVYFERQYSKCPIKEFVCILAANSKVYYCHDKAYLSDGCVGDISSKSFKTLWESDETTRLFKKFDAKKVCAQHCVYDSRNELINSFLDMDTNHVNFI